MVYVFKKRIGNFEKVYILFLVMFLYVFSSILYFYLCVKLENFVFREIFLGLILIGRFLICGIC